MFKKDSFFKDYFTNSKTYKKNLKQTKKIFRLFLANLKEKKYQ